MPLSEEIASQIPEDIRSDPSLSNFNDVGGLAKSFVETKKMVGQSIRLPGKDFTPQEMEAWQKDSALRLRDTGLTFSKIQDQPPEKPDAYEFKIEGIEPEKLKDDKGINWFRNAAHKHGLNNQVANEMLNDYLKEVVPMLKADREADAPKMIEDQGSVEGILTERFRGESKQRLAESEKSIKDLSVSIPDLKDALEGTAPYGDRWMPLKFHPAIVQLLSDVSRMRAQDFGGHTTDQFRGETLEGIEMQMQDIRANDKLTSQQQGERLEPLYKKQQAIKNANKGR